MEFVITENTVSKEDIHSEVVVKPKKKKPKQMVSLDYDASLRLNTSIAPTIQFISPQQRNPVVMEGNTSIIVLLFS